ncbi:hypothetical protein [Tomitella gaofuii]|uniref:aa3-type cytochrome oxidase subunit CtaJ n=1 Tax=Tomitella gaofuii TaxID=2760083 RepID=UPI0015F7880A|nr:hypothetical protein [Tomitella gaofuii]
MTIWETVLVYLGAPLLITIVMAIWGLTAHVVKPKYYTLGDEWTGGTVWWGAVDEAPWHAHGTGRSIEAGASGGAASGKW